MSFSSPESITGPMESPAAQQRVVMPASSAQRWIWSRSQAAGASAGAWNVAVRFLLRGMLDVAAFRGAIARLVEQHEILRTSLSGTAEELSQVIHDTLAVPVRLVDLSLLSAAEQQQEVEAFSKAEARRPFDLATAPLFRVTLMLLGSEEHVLLLTLHHAISDGWSIGLLSNAIMENYAALVEGAADGAGSAGQAGDTRLQYADYSVWQQERRASAAYQEHAAYWRQALTQGAATPAQQERHDSRSGAGEAIILSRLLPVALTDKVSALARSSGVTFAQTVIAAYGVLRCAGSHGGSTRFGVPVPGRDSAEIESIVGPFVNYLPVELNCAGAMNVRELMRATAETLADRMAHAEFRYEDVVSAVGADGDLFDSVFISQRDFVRPITRASVELTAIPSVSPGALYPLTFFLVERADGWRASCEIDTSLCTAERGEQLLATYQQVLEEFVEAPEQTVAELTSRLAVRDVPERTASPADREEAGVAQVAPTVIDFPASEAQARYWLLDQSDPGRSTFHLRLRVAVDGPFSLDCVRRALDVLVERHEVLRTTFLMVDDKLRQRVHAPTLAPDFAYFDFRAMAGDAAGQEARVQEQLLREDDWHFDLENGPLLRAAVIELSSERWILSFTLAHLLVDGWSGGILLREFQQLYTGFLHHRAVDLPPLAVQYGDYALSEEEWLQGPEIEQRVNFWHHQLAGKLPALDLPVDTGATQTDMVHGGVAIVPLDPSLAGSVRAIARELETTPFVIFAAAFQALVFRYARETDITFSTPLASRNTETENVVGPFSVPVLLRSRVQPDWSARQYIQALHHVAMDAFDNSLPFEQYADLLALSMARGRHALNQLSFFYQRAFVESAEVDGFRFTPLPTTVTGAGFEWQLAVIERESGITAELQYDAQFYTPATVELALHHYERLLSEALFHLDTPVAELLMATPEEQAAASTGDTAHLLPISRRVLGLEAGRAATAAAAPSGPQVFARNQQEREMTKLWEQAFHRSGIGVNENFFELGGHSLMLARLQALLKTRLGLRLSAADIFAAPTIAELVERLHGGATTLAQAANPRLVPIRAEGTQPELFLISQSMVFRRVAEFLGDDQPVYTIQIEDEDLRGDESFEQLARFYVDVIREKRPHGPYRLGGWCAAGWVAYEVAQQLTALGETVELLLIVDSWAPGYWRDMPRVRKTIAKAQYYSSRFDLHLRDVAAYSPADKFRYLSARLRNWGGEVARRLGAQRLGRALSNEIDGAQPETFVDRVQAQAGRSYQPRPYAGGALLFRSLETPVGRYLAPDMGWKRLLGQDIHVTPLPGDHKQIFDDPGAQIIAARVAQNLPNGLALPAFTPAIQRGRRPEEPMGQACPVVRQAG